MLASALSLSLAGCGAGGSPTDTATSSATVSPAAGCSEGWPYRKSIEGSLAATVVACENQAKDAVRFVDDGAAVVGMQVAAGTPTFADPDQISVGELTVYEAVLSAIPHSDGVGEESGRVHVLLPGKTVEVQTNGGQYRITLTSDSEEVIAGYVAQSFADWAYGKAFPGAALISELGHCATGIGNLYARFEREPVALETVIREYFPRLSPCVSSVQQLTTLEESGTAQPQPDGASAGSEDVPSVDDQPTTPFFKPIIVSPAHAVAGVNGEAATLADDANGSELETVVGDVIERASEFH